MKVERIQHHLYTSWLQMKDDPRIPQSLKERPLMHQWHYFYSNYKGRISLVELGDPYDNDWLFGGYNWEICGSHTPDGDVERFRSKEDAEKRIYQLLYPVSKWCFYNEMTRKK